MRKLFAALLGALLMLGMGSMAIAKADPPGPNGNNDKGLCTAYFNGQKKGHGDEENQDNQPPPFQGLEDHSREYTDNDGDDNDRDGETDEEGENETLTDAENIFNYCNDFGLIGGNPEHGRFTCTDPGTGAFGDPASDPECQANPDPNEENNGGGRGRP